MTEERYKQASVGMWIGIGVNVVLTLIKAAAGIMAQSKALLADAVHSASDVVGSIAVLIGLRTAKLPPDEDHPYGHGKAEPIAAIVLSVLLMVAGLEVGITTVKVFLEGVEGPPKSLALIVIVLSIVVKEIMFQYKYRLGQRLSSQALIASAWEHRSDVYSSIAAFVGIGGAMAGAYFGVPGMYYLDPIAGLLVAVLIIRMGYRIMMDAAHRTMDHVLHQEDAKDLLDTVQRIKGVISIDDLRAREHGHYVIVDVKISVNPKISIFEGHEIAKTVKQTLMKRFIHVSDVFVHVNPYDPGYPYKNEGLEHDDLPTLLH
ncbi:cation diffusion facilitator family transporter [Paenibacillus sp. YYML68]|uniref:cation diffusion facilitator family transporter n=1 Tax=Paenibacillus sp. YYML68 TaxID=2909250 RepID=UPI002491EB6D|nr:cation diffusion facilitator family transporter [Paenibacillus sp. YYML68]